MPNMPSDANPQSSSMPRTRGPMNAATPSSRQQAPSMMGQNVNIALPAPNRPMSIPEQVMMQAMQRRMGSM